MCDETVQVKAAIPRDLKRRFFSALALREQKYNRWLAARMEAWLQQIDPPRGVKHEAEEETPDVT